MRRKPLVLVVMVVAVLAAAGVAHAANGGFSPQNAHSPNAVRISQTYWLIMGFTAAIFVLVETLLIVFIVKYRAGKRDRTVEGSQVHGHTRLEVIWTVIPVVILAVIVGFVFYKLPGIVNSPKASAAGPNVQIEIDAHQFYWQFTYPNGAISIDTLYLPVGRVADLTINSEDVNHSWWIPQLGGKTDAIPGRTNHMWYQPQKIGTFHGQCSEFCGLFHERMLGMVVVTSEADYQRFITTEAAKRLGQGEWVGVCAKCHGMQGQGDYGPQLSNNPILLQPGALEDILRNGRGLMPPVGNNWKPEQFAALEAYVKKNIYKGAPTSGG